MSGEGMPPPPEAFLSSGASAITHSDVVMRLDTLAASTSAVRTTWGGEGLGFSTLMRRAVRPSPPCVLSLPTLHSAHTYLQWVNDACLDHVGEDAGGGIIAHVGVGVLEHLHKSMGQVWEIGKVCVSVR